jgi:hypothetical protein
MTEVIDQSAQTPPAETAAHTSSAEGHSAAAPDLATAVQRVLAASDEPLTVSKIRAKLPGALRNTELTNLSEALDRQVAANALHKYPKYRSQQDRYWDRGMEAHVSHLIFVVLEGGPLPWSELRRKLPSYAHEKAQGVLDDQIRQGKLHRHPRAGSRGAERYGVNKPDPKDYLRQELPELFTRLSSQGFTRPQIRAAALELLHEEEWDVEPAPAPQASSAPEPAPSRESHGSHESHEPHSRPHAPAVAQAETHPESPDATQPT